MHYSSQAGLFEAGFLILLRCSIAETTAKNHELNSLLGSGSHVLLHCPRRMPRLRFVILFFTCLAGMGMSLMAAEAVAERFVIESEEEHSLAFDLATGTISYTNGVTVRYGDAVLTARSARLNQQTGEVQAEGRVRLQQANEVWYGERIEYNFKTQKILATDFRAGQPPFFIKGAALSGDQVNNVYVLVDGVVTTDDYEKPGYRLQTKTLTIVPDEYIEATDAVLYFKDTPVFWFPKWRRNLKRHRTRPCRALDG